MNLKGYASTQIPVPIKVQNLVIRDYCDKLGHSYFMSDVEFVSGCHVLQGIPFEDFDGICAYSMSLMPRDEETRDLIFAVAEGKEFHFALEGYVWPRDAEMLTTLWRLKSLI